MEFKGQYLIHDDYKALGGTLDLVPFNLLEYDVRKIIDERTQSRLVGIENVPDDVKMCVFKMLEIKNRYQALKTQDKTIASESTDGYSTTYRKQEESDIEMENKELNEVMESYLTNVIVNGVPVLWLGVGKC